MSEVVTAPPAVRLPPATRMPKALQGIIFAVSRRWMIQRLTRRYGNVFTVNIPIYGRVVVVGDWRLAKQVFTTGPEELGNIQPNLSRLFGSGSGTLQSTAGTAEASGKWKLMGYEGQELVQVINP